MKGTLVLVISAALCIGCVTSSEINGVKFKLDRVNSNTQIELSVYRCK